MKKILLTFALMLSTMAVWAQHWTPSSTSYGDEKVIYCAIKVNGVVQTSNIEVAGFIGKECRGQALQTETSTTTSVYGLRVKGDLKTEKDQPITIKVYYNSIEYTWNTTIAFDGIEDAAFPPKEINIDRITGVQFENPTEVKASAADYKPYELDMAKHYTLLYAGGEGSAYTPKNECTPDATFKINLTVPQTTKGIAVDGMIVKIDKPATSGTVYSVNYTAGMYSSDGKLVGRPIVQQGVAKIKATIVQTLVQSISCTKTNIDKFFAYEDLHEYLKSYVTVLPENAENKEFKLEYVSGPEAFESKPLLGGEYKVRLFPESPEDTLQLKNCPLVTVKVYVRPSNLSTLSQSTTIDMSLKIGESVPSAVEKQLVYSWPGDEPDAQWQAKGLTYVYNPTDQVDADKKAAKAGTGIVTVSLTDGITKMPTFTGNESVTVNLTIESAIVVTWTQLATDFVKTGSASTTAFGKLSVNNPGGEVFDLKNITVKFSDRYSNQTDSAPYAELSEITDPDQKGATYYVYITPKFVGNSIPFGVSYLGKEISGGVVTAPTINISGDLNAPAGWSWISSYATSDQGRVDVDKAFTTDDMIEVRSQALLLYNDTEYGYGLFGDITDITPTQGMYKVRMRKASAIHLGGHNIFDIDDQAHTYTHVIANKGYTWVNNPYEFDIEAARISEFLAGKTPDDGDMIITKSAFATYNSLDGSWSPSTFSLKSGEGLIYYHTGSTSLIWDYDPSMMPNFKGSGGRVKERATAHRSDVFTFDAHAFADNMAMIAEINGLQNPEQYTIGVFVGDECRGNGVAENGKFFINAAGTTGEKLTFKLYDNFSGEYFDLAETNSFKMVNGSLRNPVLLSSPTATGIQTASEVRSEEFGVRSVNLAGQVVGGEYKGIVIKNGKKYINK